MGNKVGSHSNRKDGFFRTTLACNTKQQKLIAINAFHTLPYVLASKDDFSFSVFF